MDIAIKNLINNISQEIIDIFKIEMPIKNIDAVVEVLGGSIQTDTKLYNSGILKMGNRFVIILPMFTNERHRRFAIAQQLGHLYLHMSRGDMEHWNRLKDNTLYEPTDIKEIYQANEFATAFLMPKNQYKQIMDEYTLGNMVNTTQIAKYFDVTISLASQRGQSLGYLKPDMPR